MQPNTLYSSANPDFHKDIYIYTYTYRMWQKQVILLKLFTVYTAIARIPLHFFWMALCWKFVMEYAAIYHFCIKAP